MQHTTGVAAVAAQLNATDRRSLSQAWYSALHLAERPPAARLAPHAHTVSRAVRDRAHRAVSADDAPQGRLIGARGARDAAREAVGRHVREAAAAERRAPKTGLGQRIERRPALRPPRGATASFAVSGAGGRVHLIVRSAGGRTRVVAVCAPPLREQVERALAHARFALAGYGDLAEVA